MTAYMLSTTDNPYDPITQWEAWKGFDQEQGYNTIEYLARIAVTADNLSDEDNEKAVEHAIDEICRINVLGVYKKVKIPE